tara:strand:- start:46 stop:807 length:762 start_codon:yes stop_codon:yes gene_type:complete
MLGIGTGLLHLDVKPFQPNDVSSLEAHFSSNYGLLLTGTANGEVRRWSDISGNNYRLEPTNTNTRPNVTTTAAGIVAGAPKVQFTATGTADVLELLDSGGDPAAITLDTSDAGYCVVVVYTSANWDDGKIVIGNTDNADNHILHKSGANAFTLKAGGTAKDFSLDTPSSLTDDNLVSIMFNSNSSGDTTLYVNNIAQTDTESNSADFVISQVGAGNDTGNMTGSIKQIIIYNKALSDAERNLVYDYVYEHITR